MCLLTGYHGKCQFKMWELMNDRWNQNTSLHFIANKPAKFSMKLWVLVDSKTRYTNDFFVYTGKGNGYVNGLGYHIAINLMGPLWIKVAASFLTISILPQSLQRIYFWKIHQHVIQSLRTERIPDTMKNGKEWTKTKPCEEMRWKRNDNCLPL